MVLRETQKSECVGRDNGLSLTNMRTHMANNFWSVFSLMYYLKIRSHPPYFLLRLQSFLCLLFWLMASLQSSPKTLFWMLNLLPSFTQTWSSCQFLGFYQNNGASCISPFLIILIFIIIVIDPPPLPFLQMCVWLLYLIICQLPQWLLVLRYLLLLC